MAEIEKRTREVRNRMTRRKYNQENKVIEKRNIIIDLSRITKVACWRRPASRNWGRETVGREGTV